MQAFIVALSCFGAAYGAHVLFPVQPIDDADIVLNQSTIGTVNLLNKEEIRKQSQTPRDMIKLYLARKANLADILELVTEKTSIEDAVSALRAGEQTPEATFLIKAAETNYGVKKPELAPVETKYSIQA